MTIWSLNWNCAHHAYFDKCNQRNCSSALCVAREEYIHKCVPYGFPDGEDATSHLNVRRINAKLSQIPFFVVVVVLSKRRAWNLRTASAQLWNEKQNKKTELAVSTYADDLLRHMLVYFPQHINNRSATCRTIVQWWCSTNFEILVKKKCLLHFF